MFIQQAIVKSISVEIACKIPMCIENLKLLASDENKEHHWHEYPKKGYFIKA